MVAESNPYWLPTYLPAAALAVLAGLLPFRPRLYFLSQLLLLSCAAVTFHIFVIRYVVWAYEHPFNPTDSGPRTFAALFGWFFGLVWPILPIYAVTRFLRWLVARYAATRTI
jgi:hypothetical protein